MKKRTPEFDFSIYGINQNNLKNADFSSHIGEVVVVSGVSGSGKSTLVNDVVVAEARRQEAMRLKTDDLHVYTVRPDFQYSSSLPECDSVSQRALVQSESSTFGTRTGLRGEIQKLFVECGEIIYKGETVSKPSIEEIREFANRFHPAANLYAVLSSYEETKPNELQWRLEKLGISQIFVRDERQDGIKKIPVQKLPKSNLSNYEISICITGVDNCIALDLAKRGIMLLGRDIELNFNEHYFYPPDGTVFRKPVPLLFSKSNISSLSGCCSLCSGTGKQITVSFNHVIIQSTPLDQGFLDVPLTKAGRYVAFKFLPTGLITLLKKNGVNTKVAYRNLPKNERSIVNQILKEKLLANRTDVNAQNYMVEENCSACEGSGYGYQTRAVLVGGKPIDYFLALNSNELRFELPKLHLEKAVLAHFLRQLDVIENLAIGHIGLDRPTSTISSGEAQRLKLLEVLTARQCEKIIVLDEPSANLQYQDNLAILSAILELKRQGNCVIIVEHNLLYQKIADRIIHVGPGAGEKGGYVEVGSRGVKPQLPDYSILRGRSVSNRARSFATIPLEPKRNILLTSIKIPIGRVTTVVGSSGAGKSTLVLEMISSSLRRIGTPIAHLDSKSPGKTSTSIVATYLEVFDDIRKVYAKVFSPYFSESDFSFNSRGACPACGGSGVSDGKKCGICFGSRFRADVALAKADGISIVELLSQNIGQINVDGAFSFLSDVNTIFEHLSLSHITLGRSTSSLSGGEVQRLKLAKFILNNRRTINTENSFVILDEPSRGLDDLAVARLYEAMKVYLKECTVIVIEHNPALIYRCDYVIDLGSARGEKTKNNVVVGHLTEKDFPSLNHASVFLQLDKFKEKKWPLAEYSEPRSIDNRAPGKRYHLISPLYIEQKNFELEKQFQLDFSILLRDKNFTFFASRSELLSAISEATTFLYNPFVAYLERYPKVPASIVKAVIAECKKQLIYLDENPWRTLVEATGFDEAFLKGGGVVATYRGEFSNPDKCNYYGVRLFSIREKLIDAIAPSSSAFNLYRSACPHCSGYGFIKSYPFEEWLDKRFAPLDPRMSSLGLHRVMPKTTIAFFAKEELFDFSDSLKNFSREDYLTLLYGFKAYRFQKPGKPGLVEDDFWEWRGLNSYIYNNVAKLGNRGDLNEYLKWQQCPFCVDGFRNPVSKYFSEGKSFESYLKQKRK